MVVTSPLLDSFPDITFHLTAFDESGSFIDDLQPKQLILQENGITRPVDALQKMEPGLQIYVSMNIGPYFSNRSGGKTRYEAVQAALLAWAQSRPSSTPDELHLLSNSAHLLTRSSQPSEWITALQDYKPEPLSMQPGLGSLTQALDMLSDPATRPNMKRAILYITGMPDAATVDVLPNLTSRAVHQETAIFIWLVAPDQTQTQAGYQALNQMALDTGGSLLLFTGQNELPDLETYLQNMRYLYEVRYRSGVQTSGEQTLRVSIQQPDLSLDSGTVYFNLNVAAPNPIFLSPPAVVQRTWLQASSDAEPTLTPNQVELKIMIEFMDKYPRPLAFSRLLVDGVLVDENTAEPFDAFTWDISAESVSAQHTLQVEVQDELGLSARTIQLPVNLEVADPPRRSLLLWIKSQNLALYGGIGLAGGALASALVFAGRKARQRASRKVRTDPLTQPVEIRQERSLKKKFSAQAAPAPQVARAPSAPARLVRVPRADVNLPGAENSASDLPLTRRETTIGSDPQLAVVVLKSGSVSGLHTRIFMTTGNKYSLADAGSVAGTWLNYAPVSQQGAALEHGDLVHIGSLAYRFELSTAPRARQPRSQPHDEDL